MARVARESGECLLACCCWGEKELRLRRRHPRPTNERAAMGGNNNRRRDLGRQIKVEQSGWKKDTVSFPQRIFRGFPPLNSREGKKRSKITDSFFTLPDAKGISQPGPARFVCRGNLAPTREAYMSTLAAAASDDASRKGKRANNDEENDPRLRRERRAMSTLMCGIDGWMFQRKACSRWTCKVSRSISIRMRLYVRDMYLGQFVVAGTRSSPVSFGVD